MFDPQGAEGAPDSSVSTEPIDPADAPTIAPAGHESDRRDALPYATCDADDLADTLDQLFCLEAATRLQYLHLVATLDERQAYLADGQASMANWLALRHNLRRSTARRHVRIARAVVELPHLAEAYGTGRISFDQLDALTQLADPDTDEAWAADAARHNAEQLHTLARRHRLKKDAGRDAHQQRGVTARPDPHNAAATTIRAHLENSIAVQLLETLDDIASRTIDRDPHTGVYPTVAQQRADALALLAAARHPENADLQPATVVVHGDISLLTQPDAAGHAATADTNPIAAEVFQRLACDGHLEWAVDGPDGATLGIGRASRTWPAWLVRHIRRRDGDRCRFPGCHTTIHQIHHIAWWTAHLGETSTTNGVGLCWRHHHDVHEGGWKVTGNPEGTLTFTNPDGRPLTSQVPRLTPDIERRVGALHPLLFQPAPARSPTPARGGDAQPP